jgi:hypothetical protein
MIERIGVRNLASIAVIAVVMLFVAADTVGRNAAVNANDYSPTAEGTPGTPTLPTPVFETPTALPTEVIPEETSTPVIIFELPATGAGTTAREVVSGEHTGWHYSTFCEGGIRYQIAQYAIQYGSGINSWHSVTQTRIYRIGYCSWF